MQSPSNVQTSRAHRLQSKAAGTSCEHTGPKTDETSQCTKTPCKHSVRWRGTVKIKTSLILSALCQRSQRADNMLVCKSVPRHVLVVQHLFETRFETLSVSCHISHFFRYCILYIFDLVICLYIKHSEFQNFKQSFYNYNMCGKKC